eukprot:6640728-Prymnesium_polylepis.3
MVPSCVIAAVCARALALPWISLRGGQRSGSGGSSLSGARAHIAIFVSFVGITFVMQLRVTTDITRVKKPQHSET